jgi:hypothetical protein
MHSTTSFRKKFYGFTSENERLRPACHAGTGKHKDIEEQ